jgi:hypothetical protein
VPVPVRLSQTVAAPQRNCARQAADLVGSLGMAGLSLSAADLADRRAPVKARHPPPSSARRALGGLVIGVCAMTFAVVARLLCETVIARMSAGQ